MSKETLRQTAEKLFATTAHEVLFGVASVNEFFTTENLAQLACKKGDKPIKFSRSDFEAQEAGKEAPKETKSDVKKTYPDNAKNTIAKIKATTTLEALAEFETENEDRATVLSEIEKQKAELIAKLEVKAENVGDTASHTQTDEAGAEASQVQADAVGSDKDQEQSKTE